MKLDDAASLFSALSHEGRLAIFRLLIGTEGLNAGDIAAAMGMPPSTLSFHLKDMRVAGLLESRRVGRQVVYSANFDAITALMAFLSGEFGGADVADVPGGAAGRPLEVLFLCTGNSARSVIAEALLNHVGRGRFRAHSAGSHPRGDVHPLALRVLERHGIPAVGLMPKSWDVFAGPGAPVMDVVITVCDAAARETCPTWPGQPLTAHWGVPDPAAVQGGDGERGLAFAETYGALSSRIAILTGLPLAGLDRLSLKGELDAIARTGLAQSTSGVTKAS